MKAALLLAAAAAWAQPAAISLSPDATEVEAGRPFRVAGSARLPAGARLEADPRPREDERFTVLDAKVGQAEAKGEGSAQTLELEAAAFTVGRSTLPALSWTLVLADGSTRTLRSPPVPLDVTAPAGADPAADIRPLRGPVRVFDPRRFLPWALALLALAAAWAAWRLLRRANAPPPKPRLPAREEALERLDALEASGLWESGDRKGYYVELADILRVYVERQLGLPASRMTTRGLARAMREAGAAAGPAKDTREALEECDLVKFARVVPAPEERDAALARVRGVIAATSRPAAAEPEAAAAGGAA